MSDMNEEKKPQIEKQNAIENRIGAASDRSNGQSDVELATNILKSANIDLTDVNLAKSQFILMQGDEIARLKNELSAIHNSRSWKITAPMRRGGHTIRYTKNVSLAFAKRLYSRFMFTPKSFLLGSVSSFPSQKNDQISQSRGVIKSLPVADKIANESALPTISISVVTYNNGKWAKNFLESLAQQNYPLSKINLHIVDNSSTDDTFDLISKLAEAYQDRFGEITYDVRPNNGFGAGHDFAIRNKASAEFVLVTNLDLEFQDDCIGFLVSSALRDEENVASWEARQMPYEHPKIYDPVTMDASWSSHACILIRKAAYEDVGGYDDDIFMYAEDVELSYRFRSRGYKIKYVPRAVAFHYTYEEAGEFKPLQFKGSTKGNFLIRAKYGSVRDQIGGFVLMGKLALNGNGRPGSQEMARELFRSSIKDYPKFLKSRKKSEVAFGFSGFDYELIRDGAFYENKSYVNVFKDEKLPIVSVITRTVEGRENLLRQAMLSVANQTYPNIEHVIVQDGGDSCEKYVSEFSERLSNPKKLKFIKAEKLGRSNAGNKAMEAAKGKYLVFLDDDDLLYSDHVETLLNATKTNGTNGAYSLAFEVSTQYTNKPNGHYIEKRFHTGKVFYQEFDREVLKTRNYLPIQAVLFERKLYQRNGGFDLDLDFLEDWVFWKKMAFDGEFVFVPKTTSLYRTPYEMKESVERQQQLHNAYEIAVKRPAHIFES